MASIDSDAGIGVGTPVIGSGPVEPVTCPGIPETHLSLEEYWEFLQINECAGYGIRNFPTTGVLGMGCGDYWDQDNRFYLASSIAKAEQRLKSDRYLGFPIRREYNDNKGGPRQLEYSWPAYLGKYLRGIGVETNTLIESSSLTLSSEGTIIDPVTFTVTVTFTNENELVLYYPGTTCKIRPSNVSISSGTATITVPRCRLLKPQYFKNYSNDNERPNYLDDSYFLDGVDVYRNYLDETTGANIVWWRHEGQVHCFTDVLLGESVGACSDVRQLACPYIVRERDGIFQLEPATYSSSWSKSTFAVRRQPDGIEVNFLRFFYERYQKIDEMLKRAIIAVAHNNMPRRYCSCDVQTLYYEDDTKPLEPPVRLGFGRSTWGLFEADQIIKEFDRDRLGHNGGLF